MLLWAPHHQGGSNPPKVQRFQSKWPNINIFFNDSLGVTVLFPNALDLNCGRRPTHDGAAPPKSTVTIHRPFVQMDKRAHEGPAASPAASPGELQPPNPGPSQAYPDMQHKRMWPNANAASAVGPLPLLVQVRQFKRSHAGGVWGGAGADGGTAGRPQQVRNTPPKPPHIGRHVRGF